MTEAMIICFHCGRDVNDIPEYQIQAKLEGTTPEYEAEQDGTFNRKSMQVCCTECYTELGLPTRGEGWQAP